MSEYFPNKWELFASAPDDMFQEHTFQEVMEWKVMGWELPRDICCIIRAKNTDTGKVREYTYRKQDAAEKRLMRLMDNPDLEIAVVNHDAVHHIYQGEES
jgi:hypothetical protein